MKMLNSYEVKHVAGGGNGWARYFNHNKATRQQNSPYIAYGLSAVGAAGFGTAGFGAATAAGSGSGVVSLGLSLATGSGTIPAMGVFI